MPTEKLFPYDIIRPVQYRLWKMNRFEGLLPIERMKKDTLNTIQQYGGSLRGVCESFYRSFTGRELSDLAYIMFVGDEEMIRLATEHGADYGNEVSPEYVTGMQLGCYVFVKKGLGFSQAFHTIMHEVGSAMLPHNVEIAKRDGMTKIILDNIVKDVCLAELTQAAFRVAADRKMS